MEKQGGGKWSRWAIDLHLWDKNNQFSKKIEKSFLFNFLNFLIKINIGGKIFKWKKNTIKIFC